MVVVLTSGIGAYIINLIYTPDFKMKQLLMVVGPLFLVGLIYQLKYSLTPDPKSFSDDNYKKLKDDLES